MSQACDANLRHSDWLKSALHIAQNSWHIRAVLILIRQSIPSVNTPPRDYVSSSQIVPTILGIFELNIIQPSDCDVVKRPPW